MSGKSLIPFRITGITAFCMQIMIRTIFLFITAFSGAAHGQTMKSYDFASELDRYEQVVDHFEMARIKLFKMKVLTMERPGRLVFDKTTQQIIFMWRDLDRTGSLVLDRTDILSIEDDPKYPGMYMHIRLTNPAKFSKHLFELKRKGPQDFIKFNARKLSDQVLTEKLNIAREEISQALFQMPARGFHKEAIPDSIKTISPGSTMNQIRNRFPRGTYIQGLQGNALFFVSLAPERQEFLMVESLNDTIYRVSRLLFSENLGDADRRYNEFCEAYADKHDYNIDRSKPVFSLHNGDRIFRISSFGSRRPMMTEGLGFKMIKTADRQARSSQSVARVFYMFETDAPGSVEDLTTLMGLNDKRYQSYTSVELIDYGIWAKARGINTRDLANEAINSDDL